MSYNQTNEDQVLLQNSVARFIEQEYSFAQRQRMLRMEHGVDPQYWARFAAMGWLGMPFDEADSGFGGSPADVGIMMRQFGRGLVLEPYLANVILAGDLVARLGNPEQKGRLLVPMIEGAVKLAFAFAETQSRFNLNDCGLLAASDGDGFVLSGTKIVVPGGANADVFVVLARTAGKRADMHGLSLFAVDTGANGVAVKRYPMNDGQNACHLELQHVWVPLEALIGERDAALPDVERTIDYACAMVCAEATGILEVLFEDTLAYVKQREQFRRPLGQNQALQHRLVDMHIQLREAEGMAQVAIASLASEDSAERKRAVSAAKIHVGHALRLLGQEAVQMHGAIGTTDELRVSHYFKRATLIGMQFGDINWHTHRFAGMLGVH